MKRAIEILLLLTSLSIIFSTINVNSINDEKIITKNPLGSPGPVVARFLEIYAKISGRYYEQEDWIRDFEIHRKLLNFENEQFNLLIVDDEGDGNYKKIQNAINSSKSGDAILVYSGRYNETIIINKPIYLIGINSEYKKGSDIGKPIIFQSKNISINSIVINSDNITVSGFKIISNNIGIEVLNFSKYITIKNNKIIMAENSTGMKLSCVKSNINQNSINTINQILQVL